MNTIPHRPLGLIKAILENIGFTISHCYEDLVFIEQNAFLLRMEKKGENVSLFFNKESTLDARQEIHSLAQAAGKAEGLNLSRIGTYTLTANHNDTLDIHFSDDL